jgi:hypothetical protein
MDTCIIISTKNWNIQTNGIFKQANFSFHQHQLKTSTTKDNNLLEQLNLLLFEVIAMSIRSIMKRVQSQADCSDTDSRRSSSQHRRVHLDGDAESS